MNNETISLEMVAILVLIMVLVISIANNMDHWKQSKYDEHCLFDIYGQKHHVSTTGPAGVKLDSIFIATGTKWADVNALFPLSDERNQWYADDPHYKAWKAAQMQGAE